MGLSYADDVQDWDWGQLFITADSKNAGKDQRTVMNLVRIGSSMNDRDASRLPFLGAKMLKSEKGKKGGKQ